MYKILTLISIVKNKLKIAIYMYMTFSLTTGINKSKLSKLDSNYTKSVTIHYNEKYQLKYLQGGAK